MKFNEKALMERAPALGRRIRFVGRARNVSLFVENQPSGLVEQKEERFVTGRRMGKKAILLLRSLPKGVNVLFALVLALLIGNLHYLARRDLAVSSFYLVPICWAAWMAGRKAGMLVAVVSALSWFVADNRSGFHYDNPLIPYWNALLLMMLFLAAVWLLTAFQAAHYNLENTVQKRTAALQTEIAERKRLALAKLQTERLAVVGTMAAEVAHEVRNPLASITLNLDLLESEIGKLAEGKKTLMADGEELLGEIRGELQRIQRVIEDYLQFARLPKPQRQPVALNDLLGEKMALLTAELEKSRVKLHTHFDPSLKLINVDGEQLWQATLNLIRNGLEAMPEGGELTVGTWHENGQARLRVADTGKGMTEDEIEQVFTAFYTTKVRGTGLGLTLVQQIATEHGGHVECESTPGKGSTFTIVLPTAHRIH